jgi:hypothetical protein
MHAYNIFAQTGRCSSISPNVAAQMLWYSPTTKIDPKCRVLRMFGRSARDAVFAIVILAGYVIGTKNQAMVAILDTS